jgi:hypothetical protein
MSREASSLYINKLRAQRLVPKERLDYRVYSVKIVFPRSDLAVVLALVIAHRSILYDAITLTANANAYFARDGVSGLRANACAEAGHWLVGFYGIQVC